MATVNKVILIGYLGKDPEMRYVPSGKAVSNFSLATSEHWRDANGQDMGKTEWHNIVVWGKMAESCKEYLQKGSQVYVEGRIETQEWEDKDGNKRQTPKIIAQHVRFLGKPMAGEDTKQVADDNDDVPF